LKNTIIIFILFLTAVFFASNTHAQYEIDKHYAGPSIGLSFLGSSAQLGLNYEYAFIIEAFGTVGAGGIFRYWSYEESFSGGSYDYTDVLIAGQFNYHFKVESNRIDPWLGAVLGFVTGSVKTTLSVNQYYPEPSHDGLWLGFHGGARYWIMPTIAIIGSVGFGTLSCGALELGVDFKF
jgi:hypothetical protein